MEQQELDLILEEHKKWLSDNSKGSRADLSNADLRKADLRKANLSNANLYNVDLRNANLYKANLYKANLRNANLYKANLYKANLSNANLYNAKNGDLVFDGKHHQLTNIGSEGGTLELYSYGDDGWHVKRGCFSGTKDEFIAAVKETHEDNEHAKKYLALIEILCV